MVGPPASTKVSASAGRTPPELLRLFEEALSAGTGIGLHYQDRDGKVSVRRIEPHGLLVQSPVWYVLARDVEKSEPRMFRMDRISKPRLLCDLSFRPDASVIWEQLPSEIEWRALLV